MIGTPWCTVCENRDLDVWWRDGARILFCCQTCDTRFQYPQPEVEALEKIYDESYFRDHYIAHADIRLAYFRDRIQELERRTPHRRVIDVGCGPGYFLQVATAGGWKAAGLDVSLAAIKHAQAAGLHAVVSELSVYRPPFRPSVITMWDVIAHLRNPKQFVVTAASLLPPGGLFVIKFPYRQRLMYRIARLLSCCVPAAGLLALNSQPHHFTPTSAAYLLEAAGCQVVKTEAVREIDLPIHANDAVRLRLAKLVTSIFVRLGLYQSIVIYGQRLDGSLE